MSGSADVPAGTARHRRAWAGIFIGLLVVSGAVAAVLYGDGRDESGADGAPPPTSEPAAPTSQTHEWPAEYGGPVWITVDAADAAPRTITLSWGKWERTVVHLESGPISYEFTKGEPQPGDGNWPTIVEVDPGADVSFDQGDDPPSGAIDVNDGWIDVTGGATTTTGPAVTTTSPTTTAPAAAPG
jgi:hypothetical protein